MRVDLARGGSEACSTHRHPNRAITACTIVAVNYLAKARVMAHSFMAHHPGATVTALVIDDPGGQLVAESEEPFSVLHPDQVDIDLRAFAVMAGIYDVTELATAVKPWLLSHLLVG